MLSPMAVGPEHVSSSFMLVQVFYEGHSYVAADNARD